MDNFYCKNICNCITEYQCKEQCFDCVADVGETRISNKKLSLTPDESKNNNHNAWIENGKPKYKNVPLIDLINSIK